MTKIASIIVNTGIKPYFRADVTELPWMHQAEVYNDKKARS